MAKILSLPAAALFGALTFAAPANACEKTAYTNCDTIVEQSYSGGGVKVKTVSIQACLTPDIFRSIRLGDGRSAWEAGFYYGKGMPEVVVTVTNSQCWTLSRKGNTQTGVPGAWAVAYIDCDYYTGWVGGKIGRDGHATLQPMSLPAAHDPCLHGGCGRS